MSKVPQPRTMPCPVCGANAFPVAVVLSVAGKLAVSRKLAEDDTLGAVAQAYVTALRRTSRDRICPACQKRLTGPQMASMAGRVANSRRKQPKGPPKRKRRCPWCKLFFSSTEMREHRPKCPDKPPGLGRAGRPKVNTKCRFCSLEDGVTAIRKHEREVHAEELF